MPDPSRSLPRYALPWLAALEKALELTQLASGRFQTQDIGEDTKLQIVDKRWPNSLRKILFHRPDAMVIKGIVAALIGRLRLSDHNVRDEWRVSDGEEAFSMLLERSDIPEDDYIEWMSDFNDAVSEWDIEFSDQRVF